MNPRAAAGDPADPRAADRATLVLVSGPEGLLAERAISHAVAVRQAQSPGLTVNRIEAAGYRPGQLAGCANPSLFGDQTLIVVDDLAAAGDDLQADLVDYLGSAPDDTTTLLVRHSGGSRGRRVLDALRRNHATVLDCPAITSDRDKADFVAAEFRRYARQVTPEGVRALVEALGRDVRELAAACRQLVDDTEGRVDEQTVETYHGGRVEASGFRVADAALAGQTGQALALLRHAIATGVDPVPIVAVLAAQLRTLARVAAAGRGNAGQVARELGLAPWQIDRARRSLSRWEPADLGAAIQAVAACDHEVKGGGRDPVYAVERVILALGSRGPAGAG